MTFWTPDISSVFFQAVYLLGVILLEVDARVPGQVSDNFETSVILKHNSVSTNQWNQSRQEYTFTNVRTLCNETVGFPVKNLLPGERASVGGLLQIQRRGGTLLTLWHCTFQFSVSSITLDRGFCRCAICWGRQGIAVRLRGLPVTLSLSLPGEKEEKSGMNMSTRYLQHSVSVIYLCSATRVPLQSALVTRLVGRLRSDDLYTVLPHYPGLKSPPPLSRFEKSPPLSRWKKNKLPRYKSHPSYKFEKF